MRAARARRSCGACARSLASERAACAALSGVPAVGAASLSTPSSCASLPSTKRLLRLAASLVEHQNSHPHTTSIVGDRGDRGIGLAAPAAASAWHQQRSTALRLHSRVVTRASVRSAPRATGTCTNYVTALPLIKPNFDSAAAMRPAIPRDRQDGDHQEFCNSVPALADADGLLQ